MLQQILFILIVGAALWLAYRQFKKIRRNIGLGKEVALQGDKSRRWKNLLLVAFGQQKMFKRWVPAVLHFFIYAAFLITQVELIEIFVDGLLGTHRLFAAPLGGFYSFVVSFIEILSVLAFVATIAFLIRRNIFKLSRFHKPEMKGWPLKDANIILVGEVVLLLAIFTMNGADKALQQMQVPHYHATGYFAISSWLGPALFSGLPQAALIGLERFGWWMHLFTVLAFLNYLPISKHLHILLAFPNTWFAKQSPRGKMENMPEIMQEVKSMLGLTTEADNSASAVAELPEFGANDVPGLSWKNVLDAYSCTECGRCTAVCPANLTGKKLSPRKIVMSVRDRAEEIGRNIDSGENKYAKDPSKPLSKTNYQDGKSLFDYISPEEIHACTTCNACVEACPVLIDPLEPILQLRRYEILSLSQGPSDWLPMFNSIENSGAAWSMNMDRQEWIKLTT